MRLHEASQAFWEMLYDAGGDVVINGHDHHYERFAPQDSDGHLDTEHGIQQFTVGTGGGSLTEPEVLAANSEVLDHSAHGILQLELKPGGFSWRFVSSVENGFEDGGEGDCGPLPSATTR